MDILVDDKESNNHNLDAVGLMIDLVGGGRHEHVGTEKVDVSFVPEVIEIQELT